MRYVAVLGHWPRYVDVAEKIGLPCFDMDSVVWSGLNRVTQWRENREFLDSSLREGRFVLSDGLARLNSVYLQELVYLQLRGYNSNLDLVNLS